MDEPARIAPAQHRRRWALWLLVVLLLVVPVYLRALLEARSDLAEGDRLVPTDPYRAVTAYRHAVEWYAPANPFSARAVDALFEIGMSPVEDNADREIALRALESLRSGILVTRSIYTPYADRLPPVERRIAELRGAEAVARTGGDLDAEVRRQLDLLSSSRDRAPAAGWSLITAAAFAAWIALTALAVRSLSRTERRARRAAILGAASLLALGTWLLGLFLV